MFVDINLADGTTPKRFGPSSEGRVQSQIDHYHSYLHSWLRYRAITLHNVAAERLSQPNTALCNQLIYYPSMQKIREMEENFLIFCTFKSENKKLLLKYCNLYSKMCILYFILI